MTKKEATPRKTPRKSKKEKAKVEVVKLPDISTEKEFKDQLPKIQTPPFCVFNYSRSIIHAIMYCECGISPIKVQGTLANYVQCNGCKKVYSLNEFVGMTELNFAQLTFLNNKKNLKFEQ